ncbi:hypothetical protein J7J00_17560 [Bacillus sp. ISL-4]|uniref:hypothetical protein n=1 Tax=Bacillus sp. ISL-4 TaxID=2819125 RepID=UPI001BEB249E|nr:hypothetical protein [Bacillus sp. ISL-4]MBT2667290.1 hypothetical protein [Bacillus sp. ISL-4]MBT2670596.1 hypothetical protein [Streptomyces sp. ISL-14]
MKWLKKNEEKKGKFIFSDYITEYALMFLLFAFVSPIFGIFMVKVLKLGSAFADLGVYGDFLGGSTLPFLTIITIAFVYKTFKLQKEQLQTQKEEMRMTRETLEEQNKTARMQRFENSFFKYLEEIRADKGIDYGFDELIITMADRLSTTLTSYKKEMSDFREDKPSQFTIPIQNDYERFFDYYSSLADASLRQSGFYYKQVYSFALKINRVFDIIYQYRSSMEKSEVEFYLAYLWAEIDFSTWSLVLLQNCIMDQRTQIINELQLDNWIHQSPDAGLTALDLHFISYIVHGDPYYRYVK